MQLAVAAGRTSHIRLGLLLDNPVLHHPAASASAIATLDEISAGRAILTYGIGDTAVRWLGLRPARLVELEKAVVLVKRLLAGDAVDVGAVRPARLRHARPVPVWIAAGGPVDIVVPHPVPTPAPGVPVPRTLPPQLAGADYKTWIATEVLPLL